MLARIMAADRALASRRILLVMSTTVSLPAADASNSPQPAESACTDLSASHEYPAGQERFAAAIERVERKPADPGCRHGWIQPPMVPTRRGAQPLEEHRREPPFTRKPAMIAQIARGVWVGVTARGVLE
jgi:hypothetical protein